MDHTFIPQPAEWRCRLLSFPETIKSKISGLSAQIRLQANLLSAIVITTLPSSQRPQSLLSRMFHNENMDIYLASQKSSLLRRTSSQFFSRTEYSNHLIHKEKDYEQEQSPIPERNEFG